MEPIRFKGKYRIETTRLPSWDYGANAPYFITICTKNKIRHFGEIVNNKIMLNSFGELVRRYCLDIPNFHTYVELDEFSLMPNHLHGIIVINKPVETQYFASQNQRRSTTPSETQGIASTQKNKFGPQSKKLASIIRGFRSGVTYYARINKNEFAWQAGYYDKIIRNYESWEMIRQYIQQNPANWSKDEEYIK